MRIQSGMSLVAASIVLVIAALGYGQANRGVAPPQKSDTTAVTQKGTTVRVQHGELPAGNFQIAGIDLTRDQDVLDQAARVLGSVRTTATGDASTGQRTACYRSADRDDPTVLLFGTGEVDYSFRLTSSVPMRNQKAPCLQLARISRLLATRSGLRLGEAPDQVIAILGLPTREIRNPPLGREVFFYDFETTKKTRPRDLARFRQENPGMSEHNFQVNFGSYSLEESIQATFQRDSLATLLVDWSAQY